MGLRTKPKGVTIASPTTSVLNARSLEEDETEFVSLGVGHHLEEIHGFLVDDTLSLSANPAARFNRRLDVGHFQIDMNAILQLLCLRNFLKSNHPE